MSRLPSREQPEPKSDVFDMPRVARGDVDVGSFVDDHRRVAGSDAVRRPARAIRCAHHRLTAGREREIASSHQVLRQRDARILDALKQIRGGTLAPDRFAHHAHHFESRAFRARVWGEEITASRHFSA
jgi:hypothetical protein